MGQQWQWTFNYPDEEAVEAPNVYEVGTASYMPTLVLPVDETIEFRLHSPDVIHDFWITGFLMKMDVVPGRVNHFQITPQKLGSFKGKCAELCGVSHSRMLFNVEVVTREEFDAYLQDKEAQGDVSERAAPRRRRGRHPGRSGRARGRRVRVTATAAREASIPIRKPLGQQVVRILTTTDHKLIGKMYLTTSFIWFMVGGLMAMLIRSELAFPGSQVVNDHLYNQLFTMHGTIMLLLFATPLFFGFGNVLMPLQIGSPDVAFPRLNMLSYWLYLFGGLIAASGFLTPSGAADFGWFAYTPLSDAIRSPGVGGDLWIMGLWMAGLGTILGAVNFITTIICMRAPGMTMFRMPIFTWNTLVTSLLVLIAFPIFAAALLSLEADRLLGAHVFDPAHGGPILWQHLFWFFGHPEVYIIALPFFGIVSEILPVFSRKPIFGYIGLVGATLGIAMLSVAVWAHHMFVTGAVDLAFFSGMTFLIAVPTGVKFFNWIGTMWGGSLSFDTPMLWTVGFLITFLFGGLTGIILASPPLGLPGLRLLLRGGALPLRRVRHGRVRDVRGLLLLVAQDDRADARRDARQDPLLAAVHRLPHDVPGPALAGRRGHAAPVRRLPGQRRVHHAQPDLDGRVPSCSARRRCRSSTTSTSRATRRWWRPTTRGAGAARSSGRPAARRRGTTSRRCPASAPSRRPSTCTTPRSPRWSSTTTTRNARAGSLMRRPSTAAPRCSTTASTPTTRGAPTGEARGLDLHRPRPSSSCWSRRSTGSSARTGRAPPPSP